MIYKVNSRYILLIMLLMVLLAGCAQDEYLGFGEMSEESEAILTIATRGSEVESGSTEEERVVNTLRLMVFAEDGSLVLNKQYLNVNDVLKQEGGIYYIRERLSQSLTQLKICLVANERSRWRLGRAANDPDGPITYTRLKAKYIDYNGDYDDFVNASLESLDIYPGNGNFVMFGETTTAFGPAGATLTQPIGLVRLVAKVTMTLTYDLAQIENLSVVAGETFKLNYAYIKNQPVESYVTSKPYVSENEIFLLTSSKTLDVNKDAISATLYRTVPIVFYIPEYYLSATGFASDMFTSISVVGTYSPGAGIELPISYTIPLGEGVQQIFKNSSYQPVANDYSIIRNHHYMVDGKIKRLGEFDGVKLQLSIAEWSTGDTITIDRPAPYLNVSEIYSNFNLEADDEAFTDMRTDRIYFWTNQPKDEIEVENFSCNVYDNANLLLGDITQYYPDVDVAWTLYKNGSNEAGFFENNGYVGIGLAFNGTEMNSNRIECTFRLRSGNLRRNVVINYRKVLDIN